MKRVLAFGLAMTLGAALAHADPDPANGAQVAKACLACHSVADAANKVGPSLVGVVGRNVASVAGYAYSDAFKAFAGTTPVWDDAALDKYLKEPRTVVPGTKMAFTGVKDDGQRADLIAYLKTLK